MHPAWNNVDFNPYTRMVHYPRFAATLNAMGILSAKRYQRLRETDPKIIAWDLRYGIPFPDGVFDCVYHSHFLEHLPKNGAPAFLKECYRVLKPGGTIRVAVPNLSYWADRYLQSVSAMRTGTTNM